MGSNIYTQKQLSFSKNCLFDAVLKLLQEKEYEKITVSELTKVAGVSRSTFYRYYETVGDVLIDFLESHPMGFPADMQYEDLTNRGRVDVYFHYLEANRELFQLLVQPEFIGAFRQFMERTFRTPPCPFRPIVEKMGYRTEYELSAFTGIVFNVTVDWILGGMKEPLDDMIEESTKLITAFDFSYEK